MGDLSRHLIQEAGYDGIIHSKRPEIDLAEYENQIKEKGFYIGEYVSGKQFKLVPNKEGLIDFYEKDIGYITGGFESIDEFRELFDDVYVAFEPNQIKSATDNNGNFDINSNDITKSEGLKMKTIKLFNKSIKLNKKINLAIVTGKQIGRAHV